MPASQVDDFMNALGGVESTHDPNAVNPRTGAHGTFGIMPQNWGPWSAEAGIPGAPKTPQNQHRVARHKLLQYYNQFGSWDAVAVAWFAGPGRAQRYIQGDQSVLNMSDGDITVGEYIQRVRSHLAQAPARGTAASNPDPSRAPAVQLTGPALERFDPEIPSGDVGEDGGMEQQLGQGTDSRALVTAVMQSMSDQIAGRGGPSGFVPNMGGPEPVAVPFEQLDPNVEDALDGLGEQGGGFGVASGQPGAEQVDPRPQAKGLRVDPEHQGWVMPTTGKWSSNFGQDRGSHKHGGVDISAPEGTVIKASRSGTVSRSGKSKTYGYVVYIDHPGGVQTRYAHMVGPPAVNVGDTVQAGQPIGNVGNTGQSRGNHLHYEIRIDGTSVDPSSRHGIGQRFQQV